MLCKWDVHRQCEKLTAMCEQLHDSFKSTENTNSFDVYKYLVNKSDTDSDEDPSYIPSSKPLVSGVFQRMRSWL